MTDHLRTVHEMTACAVSCYPNAGLPDENGVCPETPETLAGKIEHFADAGWLSRGKRRKAEAESGDVAGVGADPDSSAARAEARDARGVRRSWAQLSKRIYEVDPLVCPTSGSEMKVIAFITEHDLVDAILRHLAKAKTRSPRGPPVGATLPATSRLHLGCGRPCRVCSLRLRLEVGPGFGACCPGTCFPERRFLPYQGSLGACELILDLEQAPQPRARLALNERKLLSLEIPAV
jgi:hypothetical protein